MVIVLNDEPRVSYDPDEDVVEVEGIKIERRFFKDIVAGPFPQQAWRRIMSYDPESGNIIIQEVNDLIGYLRYVKAQISRGEGWRELCSDCKKEINELTRHRENGKWLCEECLYNPLKKSNAQVAQRLT